MRLLPILYNGALDEEGEYMEIANLILGIIASILSILAAVIGIRNRADIKKIHNEFRGNKASARGDNNIQVIGANNKVGHHDR